MGNPAEQPNALTKALLKGLIPGLLLLLGIPQAAADITLTGPQHVGDDEDAAYPPSDPVSFDRMTAYPTHFHLTQEVTVTGVRFDGPWAQERTDGVPYLRVDGTDRPGTWDAGNRILQLDTPLTLSAGLHTLAVTSDCINPNTNNIVPCTGNSPKTAHDLSYGGLTLVTQTGATTGSVHRIRRSHSGDDPDDQNDDYEDLSDPGQEPFYYPDAADGETLSWEFTLPAETEIQEIWFFRLREVDYYCGIIFCVGGADVSLDGSEIGTLEADSPNNQGNPYVLSLQQTLAAGTHTLEIASNFGGLFSGLDDISWDSIILKAPGGGVGEVGLGNFNAFETGTAEGETDGPLFTKVAGRDFQVDLVHLNDGGNLQGFRGDVVLELVDATSGSTCGDLQAVADLGTARFDFEERVTVSGLNVVRAHGAVRVRITEENPRGNQDPETGCSLDAFTIRPHHLTLEARHKDRETAGTREVLDSSTPQASPVHVAGRPFTLQGEAVNANGDVVGGFDASGFLSWGLLAPPHDGNDGLGAPTPDRVSFQGDGSGFRTDKAAYGEVGILEVGLSDDGAFASRSNDRADGHCVPDSSSNTLNDGGKYGCRTELPQKVAVGRFIPDHFRFSAPDLENRADLAGSTDPFTYIGERFDIEFALTAENANDDPTANYNGDFARLDRQDELGLVGVNNGTDLTDSLKVAGLTLEGWADSAIGTGLGSAVADLQLYLERAGKEGPYGSFSPGVRPGDEDGVELADYDLDRDGDGTAEHREVGSTRLRFGRLWIRNAHGPETEPLAVPVQAQYFDGSQFRENRLDSATPLALAGEIRMQLQGGGGTWENADQTVELIEGTGGSTEGTAVEGIGTGAGALTLKAPAVLGSAGDTGRVRVRADLDAGPTDFLYLGADRDNNDLYTQNPFATATFGRYRGHDRILFWREVYD